MSEERENQLPARQNCRLREVKCDRQAPICTNCAKGSVACIVVDPITGEQYARHYVRQLEEKERDLTRRLGALDDAGVVTPVSTERSEGSHPTPVGPETAASSGTQSGFVGDGSGLGFLQSILSDIQWQHHRAQILEQLKKRPRIVRHRPVANALPPIVQARQLFDNYFTRFHVHHAFLLRIEMLDVLTGSTQSRHHCGGPPLRTTSAFSCYLQSATQLDIGLAKVLVKALNIHTATILLLKVDLPIYR